MRKPILMIDAFTAEPFRGNQAAVVLLEEPETAEWMQCVAADMNLSETGFVLPIENGFILRWFTPSVEVPLCGHCTLASAHALWEMERAENCEAIQFHTKSGVLEARQREGRIELDFPAMNLKRSELPESTRQSLGVEPIEVWIAEDRGPSDTDYLIVLHDEESVRSVSPDFAALRSIKRAYIVTAEAHGKPCDFVSRYFAPGHGIDEDPVTGAAHASLAPYWCERLGRVELLGFQASRRGGYVHVRLARPRVILGGQAVTISRGELAV